MKRNWIIVLASSIFLYSCQVNKTSSSTDEADTLTNIGGNKDKHGCLTAAGYSWSQLKKKCLRPFEEGIALNIMNTTQSYQSAAFVLIDSTQNMAEIFVPDENHSIILNKNEKNIYTDGKFNLAQEEFCWTLSLNKIKLYQEQK